MHESERLDALQFETLAIKLNVQKYITGATEKLINK